MAVHSKLLASMFVVLPFAGGLTLGADSEPAESCTAAPVADAPLLISDAFAGSEDLVFDGTGGLLAKRGDDLVRLMASGEEGVVAVLPGQTFGLRYDASGRLHAAQVNDGQLLQLSDFAVTATFDGLDAPNGVFGDLDGNIWVTLIGGNQVIQIDPDGQTTTVIDGGPADAPNGVVVDGERGVLFFTNYNAGTVMRSGLDGEDAVEISRIDGKLDGLVLDVCGSLYVVDNGGNQLYRVPLDVNGDPVGEPELLAQFPTSVANAQFGSGDGWHDTSIYVIGNDGAVYEVDLGIAGAPTPAAAGVPAE